MTAFNLTAAALCVTFAGVQIVHAQEETVRVQQGDHSVTFHSTNDKPVTIEITDRNGQKSKIKIGGFSKDRIVRVRDLGPNDKIVAPKVKFITPDAETGGIRARVAPIPAQPPIPQVMPDAAPAAPAAPEVMPDVAAPSTPSAPPQIVMDSAPEEAPQVMMDSAPNDPGAVVLVTPSAPVPAVSAIRSVAVLAPPALQEDHQDGVDAEKIRRQAEELSREGAEMGRKIADEMKKQFGPDFQKHMAEQIRSQMEAMKSARGSMDAARRAQLEALKTQMHAQREALQAAIEAKVQAEMAKNFVHGKQLRHILEEAENEARREGKKQAAESIQRALDHLEK